MTVSLLNESLHTLLAQDDAPGFLRAWTFAFSDPKTQCSMLSMVLQSVDQAPNIMNAVRQLDCWPSHWMTECARLDEGNAIDWARILEGRARVTGQETLKKEMTQVFQDVLSGYELSGADQREGWEALVLAMLDQHPVLGQTINKPHVLLLFAFSPNAGDWLARSGMDIDEILQTSVRHNRHLGLVQPLKLNGELHPGKALDYWKNKHPLFLQSWERVAEMDRQRSQLQTDWFDQWLPEAKLTGSPLEAWCETVLANKPWEGASPLEHPTFTPPWPETKKVKLNIKETARKYLTSLLASANGFFYVQAAAVNERKRKEIAKLAGQSGCEWSAFSSPMDPLAMGLYFQQGWAWDSLATPEGAVRARDIMRRDRRALMAATDWSLNRIGEVMVAEPSWFSWRDHRGKNLLEISLERNHKRDDFMSLPKALLMKIAKMAPEILTSSNDEGLTVLDRLKIPDHHKSAVKRDILNRQIKKDVVRVKSARRRAL